MVWQVAVWWAVCVPSQVRRQAGARSVGSGPVGKVGPVVWASQRRRRPAGSHGPARVGPAGTQGGKVVWLGLWCVVCGTMVVE